MPELIVSKNHKKLFRVSLPYNTFKIGRSSQNDLILPDSDISRNHVEISWKDNSFYLYEKSTGGTLYNGQGLDGSTVLCHEDEFKIGTWSLIFKKSSTLDQQIKKEVETCVTRIQASPQTKILKLDPLCETFVIHEAKLILLTSDHTPHDFTICHDSFLIGSSQECEMVIDDAYVSSQHCQIKMTEKGFILSDLGSTNGTFVNGRRITEIKLLPDMSIQIGKSQILFKENIKDEKVVPLEEDRFCGIVGTSQNMRKLFTKIKRIAPSDHTVLIHGESGTGKELVAQALHRLSNRRDNPYVVLNCGAISPHLIESELFGHEKGAFTGAQSRRLGVFEQAQGGTVFLDEIGELPVAMQPSLLRVLENRTIKRVGANLETPIDVRIIAATHCELPQKVRCEEFREDLYYRLYVVPLIVPPLRDRKIDIPLLTQFFLEQACVDLKKEFSEAALNKLASYDWPGNIRELKNVVLRSLIFSENSVMTPQDIELQHFQIDQDEKVNLSKMEQDKIEEALLKTDGNKSRAAELLGIAKSTLFKKIKQYRIPL